MKYTDHALNVLTALSYKGIGKAWVVENLNKPCKIDNTIIQKINSKNSQNNVDILEFESRKQRYEGFLIERFEGYCDGVVALGDENFPIHRGIVKGSERPVFLFYKGDISLLQYSNSNIAVIGLLNPTLEIAMREKAFVSQLVENGATIVSGLALGCDSVSHHEAINSKGKTIAILPSPLNDILPASNKDLAKEIVATGGLLITEYGTNFKDVRELTARYVERDRLQALFSDAIILTASYSQKSNEKWESLKNQKLDSGSRLAMEKAKEYGVNRVVMYDENEDAENPMFDLNREIIKADPKVIKISKDSNENEIKKIISNTNLAKSRTLFDS